MCLIVIAYQQHPEFPLILIANRDEAYQRPTQQAQYWDDFPGVLAGRDLLQGGSWLGINKQGHFAAVTNYREAKHNKMELRSRGLLVSDYIAAKQGAKDYLDNLLLQRQEFNAFNLLIGDRENLYFLSNREVESKKLSAGIYGISNGKFDSPWFKVEKAKRTLQMEIKNNTFLEEDSLFAILSDTTIPVDKELPDTGVGLELERSLAPAFIQMDDYGTRASTILMLSNSGKARFVERNYAADGLQLNTNCYEFTIDKQV